MFCILREKERSKKYLFVFYYFCEYVLDRILRMKKMCTRGRKVMLSQISEKCRLFSVFFLFCLFVFSLVPVCLCCSFPSIYFMSFLFVVLCLFSYLSIYVFLSFQPVLFSSLFLYFFLFSFISVFFCFCFCFCLCFCFPSVCLLFLCLSKFFFLVILSTSFFLFFYVCLYFAFRSSYFCLLSDSPCFLYFYALLS